MTTWWEHPDAKALMRGDDDDVYGLTPKALPAGRDLDALVAEKVMGWIGYDKEYRVVGHHWFVPSAVDMRDKRRKEIPAFSDNMGAAWEIADFITDTRCYMRLERDADGNWWCQFGRAGEQSAQTAPLAICRAALAFAELVGARASGSSDRE